MKPAYKTESNAIFAGLRALHRDGYAHDIGAAEFASHFRIHQNRRGYILTRK